jgi:uncharacterized ParB-like nuclease family protein
MAEYINIRGQSIEVVASDPANPTLGQIWYNSTSNTLKGGGVSTVGTFATANPMGTGRNQSKGFGTQTAAVAAAGNIPPVTNVTEEYDGTSWSPSGSMNTTRYRGATASSAPQTAGVYFGGNLGPGTSAAVEEYNGSTWTSVTSMPAGKDGAAGAGTQTAGLAAGGSNAGMQTTTFEYDGTNWTSGGAMGTGRYMMGYCGLQTAALAFGGEIGPLTNLTEEYDGTSWTAGGVLGTARYAMAGAGTQTAALSAGGTPPITAATELYDGTSWTANPTGLNTSRLGLGGAGTQAAGLVFGGYDGTPTYTGATEEWTGPGSPLTVTITAS